MAAHALSSDARTGLGHDERIGLVLAVALHAGLLAALLLGRRDAAPVPAPERVSVTISEESAPTSIARQPAAQAPPDAAPAMGEPAPPAPQPQEAARPEPQPAAPPPSAPLPPAPPVRQPLQPRTQAQPRAPARTSTPPAPPRQPAPRQVAAPRQAAPVRQPVAPRQPATRPAAPSTAASGRSPAVTPPRRAGASRVGADFLSGVPDAPASASRGQPATAIGAAERASLSSAIARQLKPNWTAPQGADAELLVTVLTWDLDAQGRLTGKPRVVSQTGITDSNRAQAARHAEQAIRAVQLATPFQLPAQYYAAWRHVAAFRFDRRLSQ